MLRKLKFGVLASASRIGITALMRNTRWRNRRLLILCYHGVALQDEHIWNPHLYMEQTVFRARMEHLRRVRCNVLPLPEALERLRRDDLPERSVAVTFDDGWYDFHERALPVLREFAIPATVYLTTYYVEFNRPVFDTMFRYLLWKAGGRVLRFEQVIPQPLALDAQGQQAAAETIEGYIKKNQLSARQKDGLLVTLAEHLGIDYTEILKRRILHLMNPEEVRTVAAAGVDIELHTHRHRVSRNDKLFVREIQENSDKIASITSARPTHFCYPGGNYLPEYRGWLSGAGVVSATTCDPGLCSAKDDLYVLPRVLDAATMPKVEFEAWVSGLAAFVPSHRYPPARGQFLEDWLLQA